MLPLPLVLELLPSTVVGAAELLLVPKWGAQLLLFEVALTWEMAGLLRTGATVPLDMEWLLNWKFVVFVPGKGKTEVWGRLPPVLLGNIFGDKVVVVVSVVISMVVVSVVSISMVVSVVMACVPGGNLRSQWLQPT